MTGVFAIFESGIVPMKINCKLGKVTDYQNEPLDCLRQKAAFVHAIDLLYKSKTDVFTGLRTQIDTSILPSDTVYGDLVSALHSGFVAEGKNKYFNTKKQGENQKQGEKLDLKSSVPFNVEYNRVNINQLGDSIAKFRYEANPAPEPM